MEKTVWTLKNIIWRENQCKLISSQALCERKAERECMQSQHILLMNSGWPYFNNLNVDFVSKRCRRRLPALQWPSQAGLASRRRWRPRRRRSGATPSWSGRRSWCQGRGGTKEKKKKTIVVLAWCCMRWVRVDFFLLVVLLIIFLCKCQTSHSD